MLSNGVHNRFAISLIKSCVLTFRLVESVEMAAKSPVITPLSMVSTVACSSFSANVTSAVSESSSPRFFNAPVHAKIVATEFVEVSCPFRWF